MTRVLIALRDPLVQLGVRAALEQAGDLSVVGGVARAEDVLSAIARHAPGVVLVDAQFNRADPTLVQRIVTAHPEAHVVVMVDHGEDECILRSLALSRRDWRLAPDALSRLNECCLVALRSAARGCIPKSAAVERVVNTVRMVAAGDVVAGPWLAAQQRAVEEDVVEPRDPRPAISARELEIIEGVTRGLENKEIAGRLGIQPQTVKNHLARIMTKLGVRTRSEGAARAVRQRLTT
jgi:DNA-binding NarL/FixJ family response regulator